MHMYCVIILSAWLQVINTHTHIYIYMHTYTHIYIYIHTYRYTYKYIYIYLHTYIHHSIYKCAPGLGTSDDTFHALFVCLHMHQEWATLHQSIQAFLDQQPLYFSDAGIWRICTWNAMPNNLWLKILLGYPLHKSQWSSHNLPIKSWQQIFLDYTTPPFWELLQTKARRGRAVPSGA